MSNKDRIGVPLDGWAVEKPSKDFFKESDSDGTITVSHVGFITGGLISNTRSYTPAISLKKANHLVAEFLATGKVIYAYDLSPGHLWFNEEDTTGLRRYQGLLLNIQPIEPPDSAEKIANDLANYKFDHEVGLRFREFIDRARAILAKGEK